MWESAQDRDLPECGFPKMGPQNRPTLVILIRKSNGFGVRIKLVTSSPPALNDIWLGPSFLVGVNIWKSRTESYWYWEFGQTRSTDFLNRHAPMRKTINRVDAFWWSMLLPKKKCSVCLKISCPKLGWLNKSTRNGQRKKGSLVLIPRLRRCLCAGRGSLLVLPHRLWTVAQHLSGRHLGR
jgi:hypothetical protein